VIGLWCLVFGVWCLVFGVWCLVFGVWSLVLGLWSLVFGLWSLVFGLWSSVVVVGGCGRWLWSVAVEHATRGVVVVVVDNCRRRRRHHRCRRRCKDTKVVPGELLSCLLCRCVVSSCRFIVDQFGSTR